MKKFIYLLLVSVFMASPVMAANKATVGVGPIKFNSLDGQAVIAANLGDQVQITIGGTKGTSAGTLTVFLSSATVANLSKGDKINLRGSGDDEDDTAAFVLFQGTSIKVKGFSSTTTSISSDGETSIKGKLTVVNYNEETKELKFILSGTAKPYTQIKASVGQVGETETVDKSIAVKANVVVTLP